MVRQAHHQGIPEGIEKALAGRRIGYSQMPRTDLKTFGELSDSLSTPPFTPTLTLPLEGEGTYDAAQAGPR